MALRVAGIVLCLLAGHVVLVALAPSFFEVMAEDDGLVLMALSLPCGERVAAPRDGRFELMVFPGGIGTMRFLARFPVSQTPAGLASELPVEVKTAPSIGLAVISRIAL